MKSILGILVAVGLLAWGIVHLDACATTGPNPCIGSAKARELMPCTCPATLNPGCEPWITDTKRPDAGQGADR